MSREGENLNSFRVFRIQRCHLSWARKMNMIYIDHFGKAKTALL